MAPPTDHRDAAGELGEALLQFLPIIVGGRFLDLVLDLLDARLDVGLLAGTADDGGVLLLDHHLFGAAKQVEGMQFDRGYISPYFTTNAEKMRVELEDPYCQGSRLRRSPEGHAAGHRNPHRRGTFISEDIGTKLENVTLDMCADEVIECFNVATSSPLGGAAAIWPRCARAASRTFRLGGRGGEVLW